MSDPIRAAIVSILESVEEIGRVHAYERYAPQGQGMVKHYEWRGQIRGWFVRRVKVSEQANGKAGYETATWRIGGYLSLSDEAQSEVVFDELVERIRDQFRAHPTLRGTVASTRSEDAAGIQVDNMLSVMMGGVLCHAAVLRLVTRRRLK